jgi:hypothetical protein
MQIHKYMSTCYIQKSTLNRPISLLIIPTDAATFSRWSLIILLLGLLRSAPKNFIEVVAIFARSTSPTALGRFESNAGNKTNSNEGRTGQDRRALEE